MSEQTKLKSILQTLFWLGVEAGLYLAEQGCKTLRVEDVHNSVIGGKRDDAVDQAASSLKRMFK